jgi:hypothetical protein
VRAARSGGGAGPLTPLHADPASGIQDAVHVAATQDVDRPFVVQVVIRIDQEIEHRPGARIAERFLDLLQALDDGAMLSKLHGRETSAIAGTWHSQQAAVLDALVDGLPGYAMQESADLINVEGAAGVAQIRTGVFDAAQQGPGASVGLEGLARDLDGCRLGSRGGTVRPLWGHDPTRSLELTRTVVLQAGVSLGGRWDDGQEGSLRQLSHPAFDTGKSVGMKRPLRSCAGLPRRGGLGRWRLGQWSLLKRLHSAYRAWWQLWQLRRL